MLTNLMTLIIMYIFTLYMINLAYKKLIIKNKNIIIEEKKLAEIRTKKVKTVEEQIKYITTNESVYISFPVLLVVITMYSILFSLLLPYISSFIFGLFVGLVFSILYAVLVNKIKKTKSSEYYTILIILYSIFISTGSLIGRFYGIETPWYVTLTLFILIYIGLKKTTKWII
jgi:hypothetical protein